MVKIQKAQLLVHLCSILPLAWLTYAVIHRQLGADPQEKLLEYFGLWGLIGLLLSLSMTPARKVYPKIPWNKFRRPLGLYGFFYILLHLIAYIVFFVGLDFSFFIAEVIERPYISVGILAFILLLPLVITSTKGWQRRLKKNWKRLHKLVYLIVPLGLLHFIWQSKSDLNQPLIYLIWFLVVMCLRVSFFRKSI
jgi:sulfoxide reductase heme-binding subunit YedZ